MTCSASGPEVVVSRETSRGRLLATHHRGRRDNANKERKVLAGSNGAGEDGVVRARYHTGD
jgi:hypothetical protein